MSKPLAWIASLLVAAFVCVVAGCGGSGGASASQVASAAGANSCDDSGYYLVVRATGDKMTIYDCSLPSGEKCVTYEGGIASDSTEEVQLVFANELGGSKPSCLS